jgi:heme/copper-type cytochrome/quinol oxidase subunit 2
MRRVAVAGGLAGACALALSGCSDDQNTLSPHSSAARSITTLWWVMFIGSAILVMIVTLLVVLAVLKRRGRLDRVESRSESPGARNVVLVSGAHPRAYR